MLEIISVEPHRGGECPVCDGSGKEDPDDEASEDCESCDGTGEYEWVPFAADARGECDYETCPRAGQEQEVMVLGCVSYCETCYQKDHEELCGCDRPISPSTARSTSPD